MNLIEKATIIDFHRHRIDTFENGSVEALGWRGDESQARRFEVLEGIGNLEGCSLLDVGCGHGDLKSFLDRTHKNYTYIGIDHMPEFIATARERYGACADTHFFQADFSAALLPEADYVVASGAFSYRCSSPRYYPDMIAKMYESATRALAFNMLRADRFPDHPLLVGHDLEETASFCRRLSPRVELIEGYLPDDFTVFMYKAQR